jgi:hypothetical protein
MFKCGKLLFEFGSFVEWTSYALHVIGTEFVELLLISSQDFSLCLRNQCFCYIANRDCMV